MKRRLHLVRAGDPRGVRDLDWVVRVGDPLLLEDRGTPPLPPGPIDHDQLVQLVFAADLVVTW
ncbi:MAG TPA: hypothetical protein VFQ53_40120 [Kofleriaceae bacterium]|nr:hypothetical protein [Kofleriaceae bacterium]